MTFGAGCYGYHCDLRSRCRRYDMTAERLFQYFMPAHSGDECPYFEERGYGDGANPVD